jgi:glycerol-3-phosphate acyltransferase PlsY
LGGYFEGEIEILELYAGLGAVLGHNFPFYLRFKGGKGIASTVGVVLIVCPQAIPVCLTVFLLCLWLSKYVSLGSILMSILLLIQVLLFNAYGILGVEGAAVWEFNALMLVFTTMAIIRHRANIVRLAKGTENKVGKKPEINETK